MARSTKELDSACSTRGALLAILTVALAVSIPVERAAFPAGEADPLFMLLRWFGYLVFTMDLLQRAGRRQLAGCTACRLVFDLMAALPIGPALNLLWPDGPPGLLEAAYLLPLLRLVQVYVALRHWQHASPTRTGTLRISTTLVIIALIIHWVGCGLLVVFEHRPETPLGLRYVQSVYWAVTTMTTVGYGDITPDKDQPGALLFTMLIMVIGAGAFGFIIGNIATIMANRDFARTQHLDKIQRINAFMHHNEMPAALRDRVHEYYAYLWRTRQGYDEAFILNELPAGIRSDVEMFLRRDIVAKVPLFREAGHEQIRELVAKLKPSIALPGEAIIRKGEMGDTMFFIGGGSVEVLGPDGETPIATLEEGDFFGEVALIECQPRMATVRAATYCDLYSLSREDLDGVIERYPAFGNHIRAMAEQRKAGSPPANDESGTTQD